MSSLMKQLKKDLVNSRDCYLSRQHVEKIKASIPEVLLCVSCGEMLPKGHYLGAHNSDNQWEPFCRECYDVTIAIRRSLEAK